VLDALLHVASPASEIGRHRGVHVVDDWFVAQGLDQLGSRAQTQADSELRRCGRGPCSSVTSERTNAAGVENRTRAGIVGGSSAQHTPTDLADKLPEPVHFPTRAACGD
jgi:hypothetical protein